MKRLIFLLILALLTKNCSTYNLGEKNFFFEFILYEKGSDKIEYSFSMNTQNSVYAFIDNTEKEKLKISFTKDEIAEIVELYKSLKLKNYFYCDYLYSGKKIIHKIRFKEMNIDSICSNNAKELKNMLILHKRIIEIIKSKTEYKNFFKGEDDVL